MLNVPDIGRVTLEQGAHIGGVDLPAGAVLELANGGMSYNGQRLDLALTTADVHDPTELPTYIAGYSNEEFRHEEMIPVVLVDKDEDKYRTFHENNAFKPVKVKTDDESDIPQLKVESSLSPYKVQPRRIGAFLPENVERQAGPNYDVRFTHMQRCKRVINMDLEADTVNLLFTAASWGPDQAVTLGPTDYWGGPGGAAGMSSNPIRDIRARVGKSAQRITRWWMNPDTAGYFLDNEAVRAYLRTYRGDQPLDTTMRAVKEGDQDINFSLIGIGNFSVAHARWMDPADGVLKYMMPDGIVGTHSTGSVSPEDIATAKRFRRRGAAGNGFGTREVRIEWRGAGGTLVIAEEASIEVMTGKIVGALILGTTGP